MLAMCELRMSRAGRLLPFDAFWGAVCDRGRSRRYRCRVDESDGPITPNAAARRTTGSLIQVSAV
jgi:hypothetical protein